MFKKISDKWETLTFAKLSGHFTRCFECQVHQVLHLRSEEPQARGLNISPMMEAKNEVDNHDIHGFSRVGG